LDNAREKIVPPLLSIQSARFNPLEYGLRDNHRHPKWTNLQAAWDRFMARQLRIEYEGAFYHITYRGNERKRIFFAESDYHKFRQYLVKAQERYGIVLHCYILMTNHYHFLIETPYANLSKAMHFLNSSYTTYAKMKHKRSGHLFQGRYKAILVDKDRYLLELSRYLHLNPVRAGMVNRPEDYSFSSYTCYITGVGGGLVSSDLILRMFNPETPKARISYRDFVEAAMEGRQPNPFDSVYYGMMLGSEQFVRQGNTLCAGTLVLVGPVRSETADCRLVRGLRRRRNTRQSSRKILRLPVSQRPPPYCCRCRQCAKRLCAVEGAYCGPHNNIDGQTRRRGNVVAGPGYRYLTGLPDLFSGHFVLEIFDGPGHFDQQSPFGGDCSVVD